MLYFTWFLESELSDEQLAAFSPHIKARSEGKMWIFAPWSIAKMGERDNYSDSVELNKCDPFQAFKHTESDESLQMVKTLQKAFKDRDQRKLSKIFI